MNGEWGYYLVLDEFLNDATESKRAAAGWAGDRFALYETGKPDEYFAAQLTAWDTPPEAQEFFDAYAKRTSKRYPAAKESKGPGDQISWQTPSGGVALELRGSRVAIVERVPASADAGKLLNTIWSNDRPNKHN